MRGALRLTKDEGRGEQQKMGFTFVFRPSSFVLYDLD